MLDAASNFMATHARLIDRRRFDLLFGDGSHDAVQGALSAYANPDGGFGWGIEPDLRSPTSQPAGALHAFEFIEELAPEGSPYSQPLCDWLEQASLPDGGLPFAMQPEGPGVAPFWASADPARSSLHITCAVVEMAHRVARHDRAVADHPWLARATDYCRDQIAQLDGVRHAYEFKYVLRVLDAIGDRRELERLARHIPSDATLQVTGGLPDEKLKPLDISPHPDGPLRHLIDPEVIEQDLDRLRSEQHEDGGWDIDFRPYSPAAALEWRGYMTVHALKLLRA